MADDRFDHGAGPPARGWSKKSTNDAEALGRSRGGYTTKLHAAIDALGNPLGFLLTPGQRADITQAEALVAPYAVEAVIADKGYDSNAFVALVAAKEAEAVIYYVNLRLRLVETRNNSARLTARSTRIATR